MIQYTGWPDHGIPDKENGGYESFLELFRLYRSHRNLADEQKTNQQKSIPVVHCSAGAGRTGTFIVLDALSDEIEHLRKQDKPVIINVFECVMRSRENRPSMVQTQVQLQFIQDWLTWYWQVVRKVKIEFGPLVARPSAISLGNSLTYLCTDCDIQKVWLELRKDKKYSKTQSSLRIWAKTNDGMYALLTVTDGVVRVRPLKRTLAQVKSYNPIDTILLNLDKILQVQPHTDTDFGIDTIDTMINARASNKQNSTQNGTTTPKPPQSATVAPNLPGTLFRHKPADVFAPIITYNGTTTPKPTQSATVAPNLPGTLFRRKPLNVFAPIP